MSVLTRYNTGKSGERTDPIIVPADWIINGKKMKTLIVYYTLEGNTHYAAKKIASELGADVLRIKPVKIYPRKGFRKFFWGGKSAVMAETPELEPYEFDASAYDRIIFGFPVWAGNVTPPIRTCIKENDLSGKHIAAFACQSGAGAEKAFEKLNYREQTLLEKRLAICMTCGRVGSWKNRPTFEELAVMFEGSSASGAERAYRKAAEHLTLLLVENGGIHAVRLKQKSKTKRKKKIATAVYEYQADCDGEWGEILFDFENGTGSIVRLADWDTMISNVFAKRVIRYLLNCENDRLPKETMFAFEMYE